MSDATMPIGDKCRTFGVTHRTLHSYGRASPALWTGLRRRHTARTGARPKLIMRGRRFGSLDEMRELPDHHDVKRTQAPRLWARGSAALRDRNLLATSRGEITAFRAEPDETHALVQDMLAGPVATEPTP